MSSKIEKPDENKANLDRIDYNLVFEADDQ